MAIRQWADSTVAEATGREHRTDPVLPGTGGPAGNARLTAWTGLLLLVLFLVELATLLNLDALITWHVVVGILLVPPALLKTATTGWRIIGYYTHRSAYRTAGPPPMPLRILGPLVVVFTLAVLGSGLALIALGPAEGRTAFLSVLGYQVSALTIHQGTFILWAVVTGVHTLARLLPAIQILTGGKDTPGRIPGAVSRAMVVTLALLVAGVTAVILLGPASPWLNGVLHHPDHHHISVDGSSAAPK